MNKGLYLIDFNKYKSMSIDDLREKKQWMKFSIWVFSLLISMIVINLVYLLQMIYFIVDKEKIINYWLMTSTQQNVNLESYWRWELIINNVIPLIFPLVVMVSLSISIEKCWKQKTYKYISFLPTIFIFIQSVYAIFTLIRFLIIDGNIAAYSKISWVYVFIFIMPFIYVFVWFFISRNVGIIRRIFVNAEYNQFVNDVGQEFNPFGPNNPNSNNQNKNELDPSKMNSNDAFYLRLKNLSREQLNEIGKQLSISDYDRMTKEELMKIIYDIRSIQNQNQVEKEIKLDKDKKPGEEAN